MSVFAEISEQIQNGKVKGVKELVQKAIDEKVNAKDILEKGLLAGMDVIGEKFRKNEVFVPQVLLAARAMNAGTALLKPLLTQAGVKASGKVAIGTVKGDLHDIGKNLVKLMMEGKGLEVFDLGANVDPEKYIETAKNENCNIIAMSALLTTTMSVMPEVVEAAKKAGIRDKVKIMIGGAPITQTYCDQIGADYFTPDAASAADLAAKVCGA
ncbi:MAG: corrinoid protein [Synergistaceae bacterium]|jgi:corrinoid protein of di/trimethylamine methyltransferase|nr:corrinoid protein [Synergistaceae bacterium]